MKKRSLLRPLKKINKPYRGTFITLEGGEGCGKTTLAAKLHSELKRRDQKVLLTREPGGTPLSEKMRELVLNPTLNIPICERAEMMLYLTARVQQLHEKILPALYEGAFVICDRFNDSTLAYQAYARHLGVPEVEKICDLVCEGVTPDCTLLLDLDPKVGLSRLKKMDRLESEGLQFHQEVRQGYLHLYDKYPERIKLIDASKSEEEVFEEALHHLCLNV